MAERVLVQNCAARARPNAAPEILILQKHPQSFNEFGLASGRNQEPVPAVLDDFFNSLLATTDHRLATRHGFQVNAAQAFKAARQSEHSTASHRLRNFVSALPALKTYTIADSQVLRQPK